MGRWRGKDRRTGAPGRWLGPATRFAAGRGAYGKDALPAWATDPTDEQPTADPWRAAEPAGGTASGTAAGTVEASGEGAEEQAPPPADGRSARVLRDCAADRGFRPNWR